MEEKQEYKETHPELEEGEMFLTNCTWEEYVRIGRLTKRIGKHAYDIYGKEVEVRGLMQVFVQKSEYEEGMKKYGR